MAFISACVIDSIRASRFPSVTMLPTARSARFSSGLGVLDFMKRTSILKVPPDALRRIGPAAITLAEVEGLGGHARSVAIRLD